MKNTSDYFYAFFSIKNHFKSDSYDYFKYNGKLKKITKYVGKYDYHFQKAKLRYSFEQFEFFCASNISKNPSFWITDFFNTSSETVYNQHLDFLKNHSYHLDVDIRFLFLEGFNNTFKPKTEEYPTAFLYAKRGNIKFETLIVLNWFLDIFSLWKKEYDDIIMAESLRSWKKYSGFLKIDRDKCLMQIKNILKEYST